MLGISRDTLYAYVSRGLVRTIAHPDDARRSLYDRRDIESLSTRKRRGRSRRAVAESTINWGEPILTSKITRIADGRFYYRGKDAVVLSRTVTLEAALILLAGVHMRSPYSSVADRPMKEERTPFDRILLEMARQAVGSRGGDGRPRAGELMRLTALAASSGSDRPDLPMHQLLSRAWCNNPSAADLMRRALVLCADHELNASTYAARVAASAGASLPAALLAGLSTLSGTGHGGITTRCRRWMDDVESRARQSVPDVATDGTPPPGFSHPLYPDGDPRAAELLTHIGISDRWQRIVEEVHRRTGSHPSLDFALAMLERRLRLVEGAALGIFAVGRMAGWLAHIFEQRRSGRLIRPRAQTGG